jgi:ABC-type phosphate transport system substrate-binding protein
MLACGHRLLFFLLALLLLPVTVLHAADVVLIANEDIPVHELSRNEVKNIFLSKVKSIDNITVRLVMMRKNELTDQFLKDAVGKTFTQFSNYYKKMIFTGRGRPPKRAASEADMLIYVSSTSGAIGYLSRDLVTDSVRIIQVIQ